MFSVQIISCRIHDCFVRIDSSICAHHTNAEYSRSRWWLLTDSCANHETSNYPNNLLFSRHHSQTFGFVFSCLKVVPRKRYSSFLQNICSHVNTHLPSEYQAKESFSANKMINGGARAVRWSMEWYHHEKPCRQFTWTKPSIERFIFTFGDVNESMKYACSFLLLTKLGFLFSRFSAVFDFFGAKWKWSLLLMLHKCQTGNKRKVWGLSALTMPPVMLGVRRAVPVCPNTLHCCALLLCQKAKIKTPNLPTEKAILDSHLWYRKVLSPWEE